MPDNVESATLEILKRIQVDISHLKSDVGQLKTDVSDIKSRMVVVETRLETVETIVRRNRRDSAGMLVLMRGAAGIYEDRFSDIEADVAALKRR